MENISHKLLNYCNDDFVPMHMPGHKRNVEEFSMGNPYGIDITEIDGFDNLHNPTGLIMDSMNCTAQMYGAKNTFYLVNGSTVGLLTAISAVVKSLLSSPAIYWVKRAQSSTSLPISPIWSSVDPKATAP